MLSFALVGALFSGVAVAQQPPAQQEPKFEIRRFVVDGATLVPARDIEVAVRPFTGSNRDFASVQRALEALERLYSDLGYSAVQVILPEQELEKGEVRFKIVEAKIGRVVVEGNKFFSEPNIRASVPSVTPGEAPNIRQIASSLRVANENPSKQTTVLLRSGSEEGQVDAVIRVTDERPYRFSVTFDNSGTEQTGIYRVGVGVQHANLWNRDHVLSAQYVTSPNDADNPNETVFKPSRNVYIVGLSYRIPLYRLGDSLDITAGYSNVNSGVLQNLFSVSGSGSLLNIRYNYNLPKWGDIEHRVQFGWDWRAYRNRVTVAGGPPLVPDITIRPFSLTYLAGYRTANSDTSFNVSQYYNMPGGNDGGDPTFQLSRAGSKARYHLYRFGINHNRAFENDWQMRIGFNGQFARSRLIAGEQFGLGGADSVRGFQEREVTNDQGFRGTTEFYTPDFGGKIPLLSSRVGGLRVRSVLFYDWGRAERFSPLPGEVGRHGLASFGVGLRLAHGTNLSLRIDYAVTSDAGGNQGRHEGRTHASFAYVF